MNSIRNYLINAWWTMVTIGAGLLIFGLIALIFPGATLVLLMQILAVIVVLWGVSQLVGGLQIKDSGAKTTAIITGLILTIVGVLLLLNPLVSAGMLSLVGGSLIMLYGLFSLVASMAFQPRSRGRIMWILSGVISVLASGIIWFYPVRSAEVLIIIIGAYAIVGGAILLGNAFEIRRAFADARKEVEKRTRELGK